MNYTHEYGWKAKRDRAILLRTYHDLCRTFGFRRAKDSDLAKMGNVALKQLGADLYAKLTPKQTRWYAELRGISPRSGEFRWRWFWRDLLHPPKRPRIVPTLQPDKDSPLIPTPLVMAKAAD